MYFISHTEALWEHASTWYKKDSYELLAEATVLGFVQILHLASDQESHFLHSELQAGASESTAVPVSFLPKYMQKKKKKSWQFQQTILTCSSATCSISSWSSKYIEAII
jgi:hypothetical protein